MPSEMSECQGRIAPAFGGWRYALREAGVLVAGLAAWLGSSAIHNRMDLVPASVLAGLPVGEAIDLRFALHAPGSIVCALVAIKASKTVRSLFPEASDGRMDDACGLVAFGASLSILNALLDLPWGRVFG